MRFISNGPSIPDELLLARDQGRVVFFCGAGVSRAKAKLPDFFELAAKVTRALGVKDDDPAMKIIAEAKEIGQRTGVDGLISADRIFGLLERDFLSRDIQEAVAAALTHTESPDLSAHQTLLRLATTPEGLIRLVTTNFDRLFDNCRAELPTFSPPNLPDPSRPVDLNGVVYLHGKINSEATGAEGDGFVLSSSEFGKAYLSDGWATSFVRDILRKYSVVFIGYSADDPPIHYLLEALNRTSKPIEEVYAFQSGNESYAQSRWKHKGVAAIPYDNANGHSALWDTLEAWAIRAENPDRWIHGVVELAKSGPENLQPHERGQVAHIVSTIEGARKFSEGDNPPPATWLCVFDPYQRFAKPGRQGGFGEDGPLVDPFDFYALDSDPVPDKVDPQDHYAKRDVPDGAWDGFALNDLDRTELRDENAGSLRGYWSRQAPRLPARQFQLGVWISKIAQQPEVLWWAVRQFNLHKDIQEKIAWQLEKIDFEISSAIREAWRYLSEFWAGDYAEFSRSWHELNNAINSGGWNELILRRFACFGKPYIKVEKNFWGGPLPEVKENYQVQDLISLDVEYPDVPLDVSIPDEWLSRAIVVLRRNLETALELEKEIGGYGLNNICPITPDEGRDGDSYTRTHGLSAWVLYFLRQFERLMALDSDTAKAEFQSWSEDDTTIFARLRIWALGQPSLVSAAQFGYVIAELPDRAFWDSYHARDLLLMISARWGELDAENRKEIEQRILKGPDRWEDEEDQKFRERKAWASVNRLNWLGEQGCNLQLDLGKVTEELRKVAPKWKPEYAKKAADSLEGRSGWVRTEMKPSSLLDEPLSSTLAKAEELSGRQGIEFVNYDPFAGLSQELPVRAFAVLRLEAKKGEFPEWAWRAFLNPDRRKDDRARFTGLIGEQLSRYSASELASIVRPVTDWLQKSAKILAAEHPAIFSGLVSKITDALSLEAAGSSTAIVRRNKDIDWTMEAINSPTGKLAEALFDDPEKEDLSEGEGFPKSWLQHVTRLLELPGDLRRYALVIFSHNLSWFYYVDPAWAKSNFLSILSSDNNQDQEALWAGFLWGGKAYGREFFEILKPHLLGLAISGSLQRRGHTEALTGLLLSAWALVDEDTGKKWVSDEDLRKVLLDSNDDVRSSILWQTERWAKENPEKWSPLLLDLIRNVWPRQIAAKSGIVSAKLCDLAFSDEERFQELSAAVMPLLTKIDRDRLMLPNLRRSRDNIVDLHPRETLALLHAVLPDNVTAWPYGIEATIERLGEADAALNSDERLIELKRKWDARG
ncbi:SIR2 family protein [uncultured Roseibium sp.]|uniref:SIR2 family NAD-dependent protein deacylase n=1 Tax=uncultured Roseibium sp. TaxID=1936171 RepID=UPI00321700F4